MKTLRTEHSIRGRYPPLNPNKTYYKHLVCRCVQCGHSWEFMLPFRGGTVPVKPSGWNICVECGHNKVWSSYC